jgi:hypothetical protein
MRSALLLSVLVALVACDVPPDDDGRRPSGDGGEGEGEGEGEDVFGDGVVGDVCSFNADCGEGLRCACDGTCACEVGARGTGRLNASCTTGNDCASSVCLEGPPPTTLCTEACVDDGDCGGDLPICADIAFVGRVCIREPPAP